jgi:hypothetical protein
VHQTLREGLSKVDSQERFSILRTLKFFHDFSQSEILEVLRASTWQDYEKEEEIVKEGEMDDRFYVIVSGSVGVMRNGRAVGQLDAGDCFGETSYVRGAKRLATIKALGASHADEGELHAPRAVLGGLPAALQQSVPAQPDQSSAEPELTSCTSWLDGQHVICPRHDGCCRHSLRAPAGSTRRSSSRATRCAASPSTMRTTRCGRRPF